MSMHGRVYCYLSLVNRARLALIYVVVAALVLMTLISIFSALCRVPVAVASAKKCFKGESSGLNSQYFDNALKLIATLQPNVRLAVYQQDDPQSDSVRKSLRQIIAWHRGVGATYFGHDMNEMCWDAIMVESAQVGSMPMKELESYAKVVATPWTLFCKPDLIRPVSCQRESGAYRWWTKKEATIVAVFLAASFALAFWRGPDTLLIVWLVMSVVSFACVGLVPVRLWGRVFSLCWFASIALVAGPAVVRRERAHVRIYNGAFGLLLFGVVSILTLSHTTVTPNVASVVGGKAKLFMDSGGFTSEFWRGSNGVDDMIPAYPPGLAMLMVPLRSTCGVTGVWLEQLIGPMAMVVLFFLLGELCSSNCWRGPLLALAMLTSLTALQIFCSMYPEGVMVAFVVAGAVRLSKNPVDILGWLLVGAAGWLKNEGLLFSIAICLLLVLHVKERRMLLGVAIAFGLPILWHVLAASRGACLQEYSVANITFS